MIPRDGDVVIQLMLHEPTRWLIARLDVADDAVLDMIINPGYPISVIAGRVINDLVHRRLVVAQNVGSYRLRSARMQGHDTPDIVVRVRNAVDRLGVDGILGFDFVENYTDICLNIPSRRLTLRP